MGEVQDDTDFIQAIIDLAAETGTPQILPSRNYRITRSLKMRQAKPGGIVYGAGAIITGNGVNPCMEYESKQAKR
jgi:hypothetical protein